MGITCFDDLSAYLRTQSYTAASNLGAILAVVVLLGVGHYVAGFEKLTALAIRGLHIFGVGSRSESYFLTSCADSITSLARRISMGRCGHIVD